VSIGVDYFSHSKEWEIRGGFVATVDAGGGRGLAKRRGVVENSRARAEEL